MYLRGGVFLQRGDRAMQWCYFVKNFDKTPHRGQKILRRRGGGAEIASTGKRKYGRRKYLYILVCRDDNTTVIYNNKIISVSRLIVKPD